jgi:hypothetical protein
MHHDHRTPKEFITPEAESKLFSIILLVEDFGGMSLVRRIACRRV